MLFQQEYTLSQRSRIMQNSVNCAGFTQEKLGGPQTLQSPDLNPPDYHVWDIMLEKYTALA